MRAQESWTISQSKLQITFLMQGFTLCANRLLVEALYHVISVFQKSFAQE